MRPSPTARGFRTVMLSQSAHEALRAQAGKPSAVVLGLLGQVGQLTAQVERLEAHIETLQASVETLRLEEDKQCATFDVERAILFCRLEGTKAAQLLREFVSKMTG